jgi:putative membrane protein insertion efficiency factor
MKYAAIGLVRLYQLLLSPLTRGSCKYHPSCSQYAIDALRQFGFARGSILAVWRLLRCNPWSRGGVDYAEDQSLFRRPRGARLSRMEPE